MNDTNRQTHPATSPASYPYTKIEFIERELGVSRPTASKYLEMLTSEGLVRKQKMGRTNFYINDPLYQLLSGVTLNLP